MREPKRRSSRLDDDFFMLKVPHRPNFSRSEGAFSYVGPKLWNELPFSLRSLDNIDIFKKSLKSHLFNIAFEDVVDIYNSLVVLFILTIRKGHAYITS